MRAQLVAVAALDARSNAPDGGTTRTHTHTQTHIAHTNARACTAMQKRYIHMMRACQLSCEYETDDTKRHQTHHPNVRRTNVWYICEREGTYFLLCKRANVANIPVCIISHASDCHCVSDTSKLWHLSTRSGTRHNAL